MDLRKTKEHTSLKALIKPKLFRLKFSGRLSKKQIHYLKGKGKKLDLTFFDEWDADALAIAFLLGRPNITPNEFINSIFPKNYETIRIALQSAVILNRLDIVTALLKKYAIYDEFLFFEEYSDLLRDAAFFSNLKTLKYIHAYAIKHNHLSLKTISYSIKDALQAKKYQAAEWLSRNHVFPSHDVLTYDNNLVLNELCKSGYVPLMRKWLPDELSETRSLLALDNYQPVQNVINSKKKEAIDYILKFYGHDIREALKADSFALFKVACSTGNVVLINYFFKFFPGKEREIIFLGGYACLALKAIEKNKLKVLDVLMSKCPDLLDSVLELDGSVFDYVLSDLTPRSVVFLDNQRKGFIFELIKKSNYKALSWILRPSKFNFFQWLTKRYDISLEALVTANEQEILRQCIRYGYLQFISFFQSRITNWDILFHQFISENQYEIFRDIGINPMYLIAVLESMPDKAKDIIKVDSYSIFNKFYREERELEHVDKTQILQRLLALSGESVNEIVKKTEFKLLYEPPSLRFLHFFLKNMSGEPKKAFFKTHILELLKHSTGHSEPSLLLYVEKCVGRNQLKTIFQQNPEVVLSGFRNAYKATVDYCFEINPSLVEDAHRLNKKEWFTDVLYGFHGPERITQIFNYATEISLEDFIDDKRICSYFNNPFDMNYEKMSFVLNQFPSMHRQLVSYMNFDCVAEAIKKCQPKILELLLDVQLEQIALHTGSKALNHVCMMIKYVDQPNKLMFVPNFNERAWFMAEQVETFTSEEVEELIRKCFKLGFVSIATYMVMSSTHRIESLLSLMADCILLTGKKDIKVLEFLKFCIASIPKANRKLFLASDVVKTLPNKMVGQLK